MHRSRVIAIWEQALSNYTQDFQVSFSAQIVSDKEKTRASSLGYCPLRTAYDRNGVPTSNPGLSVNENLPLKMTLDSGTHAAKLYQEALLLFASREHGISVQIEEQLTNDRLIGRPDVIISDGLFSGCIIDIKYTASMKPKMQYAMQLMAYREMLGENHSMCIVTVAKPAGLEKPYAFWFLEQDGLSSERFQFVDEHGHEYKPPKSHGDWNTPDVLNTEQLDRYIDEQKRYMDAVRDGTVILKAPYSDVLMDEGSWQCVNKDYKKWEVTPSCPWAKKCHGIDSAVPFEKKDGILAWS